MFKISGTSEKSSVRRSAAEGVVRAFTVATQMALLSPPGVDEWIARELGGDRTSPQDRGRAVR